MLLNGDDHSPAPSPCQKPNLEESQHQSTHSCRRSPRPPFPREIFTSAVIITGTTNTKYDYETFHRFVTRTCIGSRL